MKYEYTVIVERERNSPPDYKIQNRLKDEYSDWEVVSASTTVGPQFIGVDHLPHMNIATTVVLRRPKHR
jgi:hypothetical protein